jgi:Na+/H+ antiporter NhaD/arsenite permease-like protein
LQLSFLQPPLLVKEIFPSLLISALILVSVYVVLSLEIIHRTYVAVLGAIIIVSFLLVMDSIKPSTSFEFIIEVIDFNTISLLLGMMIIVAILANSGVFQWVGIKATKMSKGNLKLLLILCSFTAVVSIFIDNVTTILLMIPVTVSVFRTFKISPIPFIIAQGLASNIG